MRSGREPSAYQTATTQEVIVLTNYKAAIETARDASESLRDAGERVARELPSALAPVTVPWAEGLIDDVIDRVGDDTRRFGARRVLLAGGAIAAVVVIVVVIRRRRAHDDRTSLYVADGDRATSAA